MRGGGDSWTTGAIFPVVSGRYARNAFINSSRTAEETMSKSSMNSARRAKI